MLTFSEKKPKQTNKTKQNKNNNDPEVNYAENYTILPTSMTASFVLA